jgi:hypothetical protein
MEVGTIGWWMVAFAVGVPAGLGSLIGTYFSIKNTKGPRERAFMIKASIICWIVVIGFVLGLSLIPQWYNFLLGVPYTILLVFGIRKSNELQMRIRKEESGSDT